MLGATRTKSSTKLIYALSCLHPKPAASSKTNLLALQFTSQLLSVNSIKPKPKCLKCPLKLTAASKPLATSHQIAIFASTLRSQAPKQTTKKLLEPLTPNPRNSHPPLKPKTKPVKSSKLNASQQTNSRKSVSNSVSSPPLTET
jgi:uncharacterized protein YhhL (DUF1145 family)